MNLLLVVVGWEGGDGARCYGTKADVMTLHLSKHRGGRGGGRGGAAVCWCCLCSLTGLQVL